MEDPITNRATNLRRKKFRTTCLGFTPSLPPGDQSIIWSLSAQWDIKKHVILAHHKKWLISLNVGLLLHCSDSASIQIHNQAYNLVGIHSEKTGCKHKLYFTQQQRTENNGLVFKCCVLHKIIMSCRISRLFAIRNQCSFHSAQERWNQDSPEKKSGRLVILTTNVNKFTGSGQETHLTDCTGAGNGFKTRYCFKHAAFRLSFRQANESLNQRPPLCVVAFKDYSLCPLGFSSTSHQSRDICTSI
jgi:hypothetical protein